MNRELLLYIKNKKNYYNYLKENSHFIKQINRENDIKTFSSFVKEKYHLRATDKISDAIDNIDLINNVLETLR